MKLHHLKPAEGSKRPRRRVGRGRAGRPGQDRRPRHQGLGRPPQPEARVRGRPDAAAAPGPQAEGLHQPQPRGVRGGERGAPGGSRSRPGPRSRPRSLRERGLVRGRLPVKVLGRGEIDRALTVHAHAVSAAAQAKIEQAGGTRRGDRTGPTRTECPATERGTPVLRAFVNAFKIPDLRKKILFTLFIIARVPARARTSRSPDIDVQQAPASSTRRERRAERPAVHRPVLRRRADPVRGVLARDHAVHHQLDHHAAADRGDPASSSSGRSQGEIGHQEDHPVDALHDGHAGAPAVDRAGVPVQSNQFQVVPSRIFDAAARGADRADADGGHGHDHVAG